MQFAELHGLHKMIYASLYNAFTSSLVSCPKFLLMSFILGLSVDILFPLRYSVIFPGRNFRKARINQIKCIIICGHVSEIVR